MSASTPQVHTQTTRINNTNNNSSINVSLGKSSLPSIMGPAQRSTLSDDRVYGILADDILSDAHGTSASAIEALFISAARVSRKVASNGEYSIANRFLFLKRKCNTTYYYECIVRSAFYNMM